MEIREVATLIGRSTSAVRGYVRNDDFPHRREGMRLTFDRDEIAEWLARPEVASMMATGDILKGRRPQTAGSAA